MRPQQGVDTKDIREIVARRGDQRGGLIAVLQDIQDRYGYLPQEGLKEVAEGTGRSLVDVYGVATFYRSFTLTPRGKHVIRVCLGTACHVRGAPRVLEQFQRELGVGVGGTTPDGEFTLETVNCLGACALGPVVVVDGKYFSNVTMPRVKGILREGLSESTRLKEPAAQVSAR